MKQTNRVSTVIGRGSILLSVLLISVVANGQQRELLPPSGPNIRPTFTLYYNFKINSDPSGAYIYSADGNYWGQTGEGKSVDRLFRRYNAPAGDPGEITIVAKKPGYKDATQTVHFRYTYDGEEAAKAHSELVMIVLQRLGQE